MFRRQLNFGVSNNTNILVYGMLEQGHKFKFFEVYGGSARMPLHCRCRQYILIICGS